MTTSTINELNNIKTAEEDIKSKMIDRISINKIKQFIDRYYGFEISKNTRKQEYIKARSMFYFLSREYTSKSFSDIGFIINRDHATVMHSLNNNHEFYASKDQFYKNGLASFYDYSIRYIQMLDNKENKGDDINYKALKESVLVLENELLRKKLIDLSSENEILLESSKVSSALGDIINKIPENKLPIVVERLNAMIKML